MAGKSKGGARNRKNNNQAKVPTAAEVESRGIHDTRDMMRLGGAVINDLLNGTITGKEADRICRDMNKKLRDMEM